ncbi:MAG: hypothetical protein KDB79_00400, partial [Acidobacteria bacterium]|nr:hypothetical protein [Acidobacteriota bacterium]
MNHFTQTSSEISRLRQTIAAGTPVISLSGLTSTAAKAFVISELRQDCKKTFVIVADLNTDVENWESDLNFFQISQDEYGSETPKTNILTLPGFDADVYSGVSPHAETQEKRAIALWQLTNSKPEFLIISAKSLVTRVPAPDELRKMGGILKRDEDFPPEDLIEKLSACGYKREEPIANIGEFSMRGGIIDIWSPGSELPFRIEFFGDTVDSIRSFDPDSQLSIEQLTEVSIAPMREFSATADDFQLWTMLARDRFNDEKFTRNL